MDMGDGVTSIAWCGASLLLSSRAGAVSFLLPYPSIHSSLSSYTTPSSQYLLNNDNNNENNSRNRSKNENESNYHHSMIQSLGFRLDRTCASSTDNRSLSYGLLCSLPRHLTSSGLWKHFHSILLLYYCCSFYCVAFSFDVMFSFFFFIALFDSITEYLLLFLFRSLLSSFVHFLAHLLNHSLTHS